MKHLIAIASLTCGLVATQAMAQGMPSAGSVSPPGPGGSVVGPDGQTMRAPMPPLPTPPGTLRPQAIDPGIEAPVPPTALNRKSVIPPPGSPGGNPNVVPK
jgi:hypothetical protein